MHLLAESGGTKTQWFLYDQGGLRSTLRTSGMNPNVQSPEAIEQQQRAEWAAQLPEGQGLTLHFYGAGLGAPATEAQVTGILERLFPGATIALASDMLAAARATAGDQPGIVSILGTGSNCCAWSGEAITANLGSHGYLFSDEGSGADLGRTLLSALLNEEAPADLVQRFEEWTQQPLLATRTAIYQAPKVNVALSEHAPFIAKNLAHPYLRQLVKARFEAFLSRTLLRMPGHADLPIHFVGSIAAAFQELLMEALAAHQLHPGTVLAAPGEALLQYHIQRLGHGQS